MNPRILKVNLKFYVLLIFQACFSIISAFAQTSVSGLIIDSDSKMPIPVVNVKFVQDIKKTLSDAGGVYHITSNLKVAEIQFSCVGYKTLHVAVEAGKGQTINVQLESENQTLDDVKITSTKRTKYRNANNPAVELIDKVIEHKSINQPKNYNFLEYEKYEKLLFSLSDLPKKLLDKKMFKQYKFIFDAKDTTKVKGRTLYPIYMEENISDNYYNKALAKTKTIVKAKQNVNLSNYVDQKGVSTYLTRMYADIDIYSNNIFIVTNQFLSPIAENARNYYKYFITDTIADGNSKLVELSFTPRVKGDLLFEGQIYITLDGKYAIKRVDFGLNKGINLNWIRALKVKQSFEQDAEKNYYLSKSDMMVDFGVFKNGKSGVYGERNISFKNYIINKKREDNFYDHADSLIIEPDAEKQTAQYWKSGRTDSLTVSESQVYHNMDSLQKLPSFKRVVSLANFLVTGYKKIGPVEIGPASTFFSFNSLEDIRVRLGGRTLPTLSKTWYFEGYGAYGFKDEKWKYALTSTYSIDHKSIYTFPNHYIRASFQRDTKIPGQGLEYSQENSFLLSFKRGLDDKWLYADTYSLSYLREFSNHFSYEFGLKKWTQTPQLALVYKIIQNGQERIVNELTSSEFSIFLRWAPHEQFIQGKSYRTAIPNKYPVIAVGYNAGIKNLLGGEYNYQKIYGSISKRFYLSRLGFTDITIEGRTTLGQVPFPLLNTVPANQTYDYLQHSFNLMNFMEFVGDHSVSLFLDHSFAGFLLNKVPLIRKLKLRESVSFKMIYGGLRAENNPVENPSLYQFPLNLSGQPYIYSLEKTPYTEIGFGISNIFKVIRVDAIRRLNYLDHPNVSKWGIRISYLFDF